jgi:hypothetical protein
MVGTRNIRDDKCTHSRCRLSCHLKNELRATRSATSREKMKMETDALQKRIFKLDHLLTEVVAATGRAGFPRMLEDSLSMMRGLCGHVPTANIRERLYRVFEHHFQRSTPKQAALVECHFFATRPFMSASSTRQCLGTRPLMPSLPLLVMWEIEPSGAFLVHAWMSNQRRTVLSLVVVMVIRVLS